MTPTMISLRTAQRNRNAKVRNAVKIINGAIKRVDDPLVLAGLIADDSFFAIKCVTGKFFEKQFVISSCA